MVFEVLKRADEFVGCRLYALEGMYLIIVQNHSLVLLIHIDHREELDVIADTLEIVTCTLDE